ncbi:hypothetical protein [Allokutzneria oryzae]|uniref:Uncharacterized protein n=1 Tax=Allokutzneria oryzae TaxID=1378989 RepID=A0ABV6A0L1_9PSEU
MRFVIASGEGIDPSGYLAQLPRIAPALPPGARAFAEAQGHYDLNGPRCVKDLVLSRVDFDSTETEVTLELRFRHRCGQHVENLLLRYYGVSGFMLESPEWSRYGPLLLDEVLPHAHGLSHEIGHQAGSLAVIARDLSASWTASDCPERSSALTQA